MDSEIVRLASRRVPRYTSYPTAVQFTGDVGPQTYREWLGQLASDTKLSVYVHVPFCRTLCFYCGCHTRAERNADVIADYAKTLCAEIGLVAGATPEALSVAHIHWGGGTPTELGGDGLARVLSRLGDAFGFGPDLEHAIELDPRRVDSAAVRLLAWLGVNRVSFGVQTFDAPVQLAIGRVQPFEQVRRAVDMVRDEGIDAISFDLMYGLPHQTVQSVVETATKAASLRPRRLSVFGYAHVPWMKKVQGGVDVAALPAPAERLRQMSAIREVLVDSGYVPVGFDHFALPDDPLAISFAGGALHRNFQGYTTDVAPALIGLGASAIGRLPAGYVQNSPDLRTYAQAVAEERFATARGRMLSAEDEARASLIEDVLCSGRVSFDDRLPRASRQAAIDALKPLSRKGLVAIESGGLQVTETGWPFARLIASAFDAYFSEKSKGHSLAI
jgi:oxygen-independent coproporphyrinogen-3 oxidase